jgi:hypothetical protein
MGASFLFPPVFIGFLTTGFPKKIPRSYYQTLKESILMSIRIILHLQIRSKLSSVSSFRQKMLEIIVTNGKIQIPGNLSCQFQNPLSEC